MSEDEIWKMLEHVLRKRSPHLGGKAEDLQKHIYDMHNIYSEYMESFINISAILHKNIIFSKKDVYPKLLFEQVFTQNMAWQGFPPLLAPNTPIYFIFNINVVIQFYIKNTT